MVFISYLLSIIYWGLGGGSTTWRLRLHVATLFCFCLGLRVLLVYLGSTALQIHVAGLGAGHVALEPGLRSGGGLGAYWG